MKTVILTPADLKNFPVEIQNSILEFVNTKEVLISDLKKRINALSNQLISYRDDNNTIESTRSSEKLEFRVWSKTAGEQWGNNRGRSYIINVGRKYITISGEGWSTNSRDWDCPTFNTSVQVIANVVSILEEAEKSENPDSDALIIRAINQIVNLVERY
jgi:hypothetical protein